MRGAGESSKTKKGKDKEPPLKNQKRITSFFGKRDGSVDEGGNVTIPPVPDASRKDDKKNVQMKRKAADDQEDVIVLSSDSEGEVVKEDEMRSQYFKPTPATDGDNDSIVPTPNISLTPCGETGEENDAFGDSDSGDAFLSQLDVDEIISSSQESTSSRMSRKDLADLSPSSGPKVINRSLLSSPKAKVNRFSPLTKLNASRSKSPRNPSSGEKSLPGSASKERFASPSQERSSNTPTKSPVVRKLHFPDAIGPYYLRNFQGVIDSAADDPFNAHLLSDFDKETVTQFRNLSIDARCLFARLFQRKWQWKPASSISYPQIRGDLGPVFQELHSSGFLVEIQDPDIQSQLDLESLLNIKAINGEQIKSIAKEMKANAEKNTKEARIDALLKLAKTKSVFSKTSIGKVIMTKVLALLGPTYQLEGERRAVLSRLFMLYSPPQYWDDEQEQSLNQMLKIFMAETGTMKYPPFCINKTTSIYHSRDDFISFYEAWCHHCDAASLIESKKWEDLILLGEVATSKLESILSDALCLQQDLALPQFLRIYKAGSVYTRIVWLTVEGHQKLRNYEKANEVLRILLNQDIYLRTYRGRWYERIAINMKQLKMNHSERQRALEEAIQDRLILDSHKLCISERFEKLQEEINNHKKRTAKKRARLTEDAEESQELINSSVGLFSLRHAISTHTIKGEKMLNPNSGKSVFLSQQDSGGSSEASSVELFAASHYSKIQGYTNGIHGEGAIVATFFGLLFWDEIYDDSISDTFHSVFQPFPLDFAFEDFYQRRKEALEAKLETIRQSWTLTEAFQAIETVWENHADEISVVNWTLFKSVAECKSLLKAIGLPIIADICERLAKNFRHHRAGFPDLVVWNDTDFKFVEVKGPGDSLSYKQKIWLDFLITIGAKAEVCSVQHVSNKRLG